MDVEDGSAGRPACDLAPVHELVAELGGGHPAADDTVRLVRILMLGEALVDLVCERPVERVSDADAFVPHPGGAVANAAAVAASLGARVELLGGAGDDDWGRWLRKGLDDAGVGLEWFSLLDGVRTPVALVWVDAS
ncbi:MAG: fructokinase, partial [Solirubrobacteraceae bacterium]|nr:fructokinase [Solirubrobacteraceae bacterium]